MQMNFGVRGKDYMTNLRRKADEYGMFIEGSIGLPKSKKDTARFEAEIKTASTLRSTPQVGSITCGINFLPDAGSVYDKS